jgi:hypothetical protein
MSDAIGENGGPDAGDAPRAKRNLPNVRWMALGALLLVVGVTLGDRLIVANVVEKNAALAEAYHSQEAKLSRGAELTDEEKSETRETLLGDPLLVGSVAAMLLILPFAVGVAIGWRTGSMRDAAIAVAAGMVTGFALERTGAIAMAVGAVVYLGFGLLAGLLGRRLAARRAKA